MSTECNQNQPIGEVTAIKDGEVIITFSRSSACGSCNACGLVKETGEMTLHLPKVDEVQVGDKVAIMVEHSFFLTSALLLYGIPLLVLIGVIAAGSLLFSSEMGQIITAVSAFLLASGSYFLLRLFRKRFDRMKARRMTYKKVE